MPRADWSEIEDMACLYLYLKSGGKQLDDSSIEVKELAKAIGRSPAAVSFKSGNFRFIDPKSDRKGFKHGSATDRRVWNSFSDDIDSCREVYEMLIDWPEASEDILQTEREINSGNYHIPDLYGMGKKRVGSIKIKLDAMSNYSERCCVCGIEHPNLLIASHIIPWKDDEFKRADPRNVLLLCALHDKLFDKGLISLSDDYKIIVARLGPALIETNRVIMYLDGKEISLPADKTKFPKLDYLDYHRKNIFKG